MEFKKYKKGFTLLEMLVAFSISIVIGATIISVYFAAQRSFSVGAARLNLHNYIRIALEWLNKDIKWATQVIATRTINATVYTTANNQLILELPSIDSNGDIIDSTFDYVAYALNNTDPANVKLERIVDPNGSSVRSAQVHPIASNISVLNFSSGGVGLGAIADLSTVNNINVTITVTTTVVGGTTPQETAKAGIKLRNK